MATSASRELLRRAMYEESSLDRLRRRYPELDERGLQLKDLFVPRRTPPIVREGPRATAVGARSPLRAGQVHILARAVVLAERPRLASSHHDAQDDGAPLLLVNGCVRTTCYDIWWRVDRATHPTPSPRVLELLTRPLVQRAHAVLVVRLAALLDDVAVVIDNIALLLAHEAVEELEERARLRQVLDESARFCGRQHLRD